MDNTCMDVFQENFKKLIKPWSGLDLAMGYKSQTSDVKKTVPLLYTFWVDTDNTTQCISWSLAGPHPVCVLKVLAHLFSQLPCLLLQHPILLFPCLGFPLYLRNE